MTQDTKSYSLLQNTLKRGGTEGAEEFVTATFIQIFYYLCFLFSSGLQEYCFLLQDVSDKQIVLVVLS